MLHKRAKGVAMSDTIMAEMQGIVRRAAEPPVPGETIKAQIGRASRNLSIGFRRARSFWYASAATVSAAEADHLRAEDERRLVNRRIRLEQELEWIKARGNARSGAHGSISGADRAHLAAATGANPESMSAARGEVDSSSERAGAEAATIADPRQLGWGW